MSLIQRIFCLACVVGSLAALSLDQRVGGLPEPAPTGKSSAQADAIRQIVRETMAEQHLKAVIVSVTVDGKNLLTEAFGESLPGVPATTDMNFRNGAVAFQYVEQPAPAVRRRGQGQPRRHHRRWLPELPDADKVTLRMLANQTAGYPDFEQDPAWIAAYYAEPVPQLDVRGTAPVRARPRPGRSRPGRTGATRTRTS